MAQNTPKTLRLKVDSNTKINSQNQVSDLEKMPQEITVNIASFLLPCDLYLKGPIFDWTGELQDHRISVVGAVTNFAVLLTIYRSLRDLLTPYMYTQIQVRIYLRPSDPNMIRHNTSLLLRTLEHDKSIRNRVKTVRLQEVSSGKYGAFFNLPQIHTITIDGFDDRELLESRDIEPYSSSKIEELYLINCGVTEESLAKLLSWPNALKVFCYQVD